MKRKIPRHLEWLQLALLLVLIAYSAAGTFGAPGALDPLFGIKGKITTSLGSNSADAIHATAIQSDGKIVAVGERNVGFTVPHSVIARYNPDGSLDPTFSSTGLLILQISATSGDAPRAVGIQPDGKIVVAGSSYNGPTTATDFYILRLNENGSFDNTFGSDGKAFVDFAGLNESAFAMLLQPDGKIVVGGQTATPNSRFNFALTRLNIDGSLDVGFGNGGRVNSGPATFSDLVHDLKLQADGKIVAAGRTFSGTTDDFAVHRYNSDGSLDTTFDTDGVVSTPFGGHDYARAVNIQPDGKIVASGTAGASSIPFDSFAIARYNTDGSLDSTFDGDGKVTTSIIAGAGCESYDGIIQPDGRMLLVGRVTQSRFALARYNSDGSLDTSFNGTGTVITSIGTIEDTALTVALLGNGKILASGSSHGGNSERDFALARYEPNGALDLTFGPPGLVTTAFQTVSDSANDIAVQPDGKILAIGRTRNSSQSDDFAVARYAANGELDTTFSNGGRLILSLSSGNDVAHRVALQGDGKILLAGYVGTSPNSNFAIVRLNSNGATDSTFGTNGRVNLPIGPGEDVAYDLAVQVDGKILVAGRASINSSADFAVARLLQNGVPDPSFDNDGITTFNFSGGDDVAASIGIQIDGKVVVVGHTNATGSNSDIAIARLDNSGALDTSFGNGGKVVTQIGTSNEDATTVAIQADGRIVVAGFAEGATNREFVLCRYSTNGTLDPNFDFDGIVVTPVGSDSADTAFDVTIQRDGKILAAGQTIFNPGTANNSSIALVRYNPDGALDATFDGDGILVKDYGNRGEYVRGIALQADGKIVGAGNLNGVDTSVFAVLRFLGDAGQSIADFDGDGKTDLSIFRPAVGEWFYQKSSDGVVPGFQFGVSTDKIVPGDYTGDGKTDIAIWRPSTGFWFILRSEDFLVYGFPFGTDGDVPVPGDYDGDGKTDAAVFRPSTVTWIINKSSGGTAFHTFGAIGDKPVVADYDGDGKTDIAIYRPSVGEWYYQRSSDGVVPGFQFGSSTDKPVQGDYTGDGKADIAFWRPSTGFWYVLRSEDFLFYGFPWGLSTDLPAPGDFDGDGKMDASVFRPSDTVWYINRSTAGVFIQQFGAAADKPVPSAYVP